ncbi:MAG: ABC transporter permease [Chloroflexia bacterium]|nr:ABC transporter permease [Chloroflexia bacterium]
MNFSLLLDWRNLKAHSLRSLLTTLAIALGVAMVLAAAIVGQAVSQQADRLDRQPQGLEGTTFIVQLGLAMIGAIMLFAAGFVILNAFAIAVTNRTRQLGILRALGMTRRQMIARLLSEAGLLGLLGALLGLLLGLGLAWAVIRLTGSRTTPVVPWWGWPSSLLLGLGVTTLAALLPARQAGQADPLEALYPRRRPSAGGWYIRCGGRWGRILLLATLPAIAALALLGRPQFYPSLLLVLVGQAVLLLAAVLLLPALLAGAARRARAIAARRLQWAGWLVPGRLAADNLLRNRLRSVLTAGALVAILTTIVGSSGLLTAILKGGLRGYFQLFNEDAMLVPDIAGLLASGDLSMDNTYARLTTEAVLDPALVEAVEGAALQGGFTVERIGFAPIPAELGPIPGSPGVFVEPELFLGLGNFDFFQGDPVEALELLQRGRAVLLFPIVAERLQLGVGDAVAVQTRHGEIPFTVAGIGGNGYSFAAFSYADGEDYFDLTGPSWLGLIVPPGQDVDSAVAQVRAVLEPFEGVAIGRLDDAALEATWFKMIDQLQLLLNALLLLAVLVAAVGVVNTMVINVAERRRELFLLRAIGASRRQVQRAVMIEAVLLGLLGSIVAIGLGLAMLALFVLALTPGGTSSMGFRVSWQLAWQTLLPALRDLGLTSAVVLLVGPAVAALAAYWPARLALRTGAGRPGE